MASATRSPCSTATCTSASKADQRDVAALLIERLHRELLENLKAEIGREEGAEPAEDSIAALVADRDWLFLDDAYHIDTSHLHSVVRFARLVDDPEAIRKAIDLTEYGRRLSAQYQFQTEEPFSDTYESHARFFGALVGQNVEEALEYFGEKAKNLSQEEHGTGPAEVYVALLARLGRHAEALEAAGQLPPPNQQLSGFAPSLLELAREARDYDTLRRLCRERGDVLGFTVSLVEAQQKSQNES